MLRKIFYALLAGHCALAHAAAPTPPAASGASATNRADSAPASATAASTKTNTASTGLIRVGGSDLLETVIGEPLTRYAKQARLNIIVDMIGSPPAMDGLKSGDIQLAIVAVPVGQKPAPDGFKAIPFCFAVDYVIVNQANPLTALNLRQLSGIFGNGSENINSWSQLKLSGDWASRPITGYATSDEDGIVVEMLKYLALNRQPLRSNIHILTTPDDVIKSVASSENGQNAIGVCGYDPGPPNKVLLISPDKTATVSKDAVRPTPENIFNGDYPLRLPFYLIYNPADQARVLPLVRLLLGDTYAARLSDAHFIPLPDTERNNSLLELDKPQ